MSQSPKMRGWMFQILNEFKGQYTIAKEPSIIELTKCGPNIIPRLLEIINAVLAAMPAQMATSIPNKVIAPLRSPRSSMSNPSSPKSPATMLDTDSMDLTTARENLQAFREESHRKILSFHHTKVPRCWRRLFTDATLLMVLADLQLHPPPNSDVFYKGLVGRLDEAIVITNAPGKGRMDMCHDAIARIQDEYLPLIDPATPSTSLTGPGAPYPLVFDGITTPLEVPNINKRPKRSARNAALRPADQGTWVPTSGRQFPLPSSSSLHVPRLFDPPSVMDFREWYYTKPFIINKYAADWPACANWGSPQYLRTVGGLGRKVPVETTASAGEDYTSESWTTSLMDWEGFLDALCARSTFHAKPKAGYMAPTSATGASRPGTPTTAPPDVPRKRGRPPLNKNLANPAPVEEWSGPSYYLAQHDLINQFPELRGDIIVPDYVYSGVPAPSTPPDQYPDYHPPNVEGNIMINNWIGPKGTITPAHTDPYYNCYVQVVGKKTIWLAPPRFKEEMYAYAIAVSDDQTPSNQVRTGSDSDAQASSDSRSQSATSNLSSPPSVTASSPSSYKSASSQSLLSNTSRVPVFSLTNDTREKFPRFFTHVQPQAMSAVLEPGDLLFFPPGWWHAMRSEETSASVSMWF